MSEFGKGFIYNLALFINHFSNEQAHQIYDIEFVRNKPEAERKLILAENPDPKHNYGFNARVRTWYEGIVPIYGTVEKALGSYVQLWFNGASDHLYELEIPPQWKKKKIGTLAKMLQSKALDIGHGSGLFHDGATFADMKECIDLTFSIVRLVDEELGVEVIKADYE
jgi:hypothetical protein